MLPTIAYIFVALLMSHCLLRAEEPDILDLIQAHPVGITSSAGKPKYGDPDVDAAVKDLADIPHPWTVPKILALFAGSPWYQRYKEGQPVAKDWPGWESDEERQAHIATILAGSRDPRVVPVLIQAMNYHSTSISFNALRGLYFYILPDNRFHQLPRDPEDSKPHFYTNFIPVMQDRVQAWWELNKDAFNSSSQKALPSQSGAVSPDADLGE
jgi:hypothetical protein